MSKFKIPINTAMMHIQNLKNEMQEAYGITIHDDTSIPINSGGTSDGPTGTFNVRINQPIRLEGLFHKQANTMDFVDYIRILHHEEQHIVQAITDAYIQDATLEQDVDAMKQMSIKNIACIGNHDYYRGSNHSYNNNLAEIDAEYTAISNTYDFLRDYVSPKYAEQMICDMVNQKVLRSDYFIQKVCSSFDDIADAFSDKYEQAKFSHIYHPVVRLRPSQNVNQDSDEYIKYLQQVVKDDPNNMWLMEQFWNVTDVDEKDKMVASIVLHMHPEIDYKRLYPCLQQEDLSPKTIFGRDIPDVPVVEYNGTFQKLTAQLQQADMSLRIDKSDDLYSKVLQSADKIECMSSKTNEKLRKDLIIVKNNEKSYQLE